jgi:hypothetical protein
VRLERDSAFIVTSEGARLMYDDLQTLGRSAGIKARDEALEAAVKIIEAQLCGRSAVDYALHMCIAEIRKLKSNGTQKDQS